jgi:uncharacterized protein (DUF1697 family)
MKTYVALFRGINVGGKGALPMEELVALLEDLGSQDVRTYIQSGDASLLSRRISAAIRESRGFEPRVLLLEPEEMERVLESNPFPEAEPKTLHVFFPAAMLEDPDLDALESLRSGSERFALRDGVLYLHAPDGIGRSRLAANAEKVLGVPMTARNWRTVRRVLDMARQCG